VSVLFNRLGSPSDVKPVALKVAREDLYRRRFRVNHEKLGLVAVDLDLPPKHGEVLTNEAEDQYCIIDQIPEQICVIPMPEDASFAAKIGWYLGNRHIPIEVREDSIRLEVFPTLIDSLDRIGIPYETCNERLYCAPHSADHRHT